MTPEDPAEVASRLGTDHAIELGVSPDGEVPRHVLLERSDHDDGPVRVAAIRALPGTAGGQQGGVVDPEVVAALVRATCDPVADVRRWATFGLGLLSAVGPEVEQALLDRLDDNDPETRSEAVRALADRRHERAVEPLIAALRDDTVDVHVVDAAGWFADLRLYPALVDLATSLGDDDTDPAFVAAVDAAIGRCDPGSPAAAEQIEVAILAVLQSSAAESGHPVDAALVGDYPVTEVVLTAGDREQRSPIWNFDDQDPDDPGTLDQAFTFYRLANLASRI